MPMSAELRVRILREAAPNSWIALSSDESELVAVGASYQEAVEGAEAKGENNPLLIKTPEKWLPLVMPVCA